MKLKIVNIENENEKSKINNFYQNNNRSIILEYKLILKLKK